jgi:hypothetical protein
MANYNDAVRLAQQTGTTPDGAQERRYSTRPGLALNLEQQVMSEIGVFLRASVNDGHKEVFEFTEINRSLATGVSVKGERWLRPNDTFGLVGVVNDFSKDARNYFAAGGLGVLIGDGQLPRAGLEKILEVYYNVAVIPGINSPLTISTSRTPLTPQSAGLRLMPALKNARHEVFALGAAIRGGWPAQPPFRLRDVGIRPPTRARKLATLASLLNQMHAGRLPDRAVAETLPRQHFVHNIV